MTVVEDKLFWHEGPEPECWDDAARRCVYAIYSLDLYSMDKLEDIRTQLDYLIKVGLSAAGQDILSSEEFAELWRILGAVARNTARNSNILDYSLVRPGAVVDELTSVLIKKQKDYGHDNINRFGRLGLLVRVHDKVARIENLMRRGTSPENESLRDNYMDVINYCAIGMMVEMDWFLLELASQ
jgi:hypothetical protein